MEPNEISTDKPSPFLDFFETIDYRIHRLPHWFQANKLYFVTWRCADSIPKQLLWLYEAEKRNWLQEHPKPWTLDVEAEYHRLFSARVDEWLDRCKGKCLLRQAGIRSIVQNALLHFNELRYDLWASVVMPNHVHVVVAETSSHNIGAIVKSWKGFSAREINKAVGSSGAYWQEDYFDRLIRSVQHLTCCIRYILDNPRKARLAPSEYSIFLSETAQQLLGSSSTVAGGGLENPPSFLEA